MLKYVATEKRELLAGELQTAAEAVLPHIFWLISAVYSSEGDGGRGGHHSHSARLASPYVVKP